MAPPGIAVVMPKLKHLKHMLAIVNLVPLKDVLNREELYLVMAGFAKVMPKLKRLKHTLDIVIQETVNEPNAIELIQSSE